MTNRMDHTNCPHDATPAGRKACRNFHRANAQELGHLAGTIFAPNNPTIKTPVGNIRAGSIIMAEVRGGRPEQYTVLVVEANIKNEYPGWEADGRWGYADQVLQVIKF